MVRSPAEASLPTGPTASQMQACSSGPDHSLQSGQLGRSERENAGEGRSSYSVPLAARSAVAGKVVIRLNLPMSLRPLSYLSCFASSQFSRLGRHEW